MNINIIEKNENKLLARTEVVAKVTFEGATPKRHNVQVALAKELKAKEDMVIINSTKTSFGEASAKVFANVYDNAETMAKLERQNLIEKHKGHEPKKEEEDN